MAAKRERSRTTTELKLPLRFGSYELVEAIARGGMGTVYRARHVFLDKSAAIKILRDDIPHREAMLDVFRREAQVLARLDHPAIIQVMDVGEVDGVVFIAMDYAPGMDLARWVKRDGKLSLHNLLHVSQQVVEGIASAHQAGVLHRDIKPDNIIADHHGSVKVGDFGLAGDVRLAEQEKLRFATPAYAAPEVLDGGECDTRSDVFSLAATLYYLASGVYPFGKESVTSVMIAQQKGAKPIGELEPSLPQAYSRALMESLELDREKRPRDAIELLARMFPADGQRRIVILLALIAGSTILILLGVLVVLLLSD